MVWNMEELNILEWWLKLVKFHDENGSYMIEKIYHIIVCFLGKV